MSGQPGNVPINSFILKIASRCNLNCHYCYVYNMGDNSYRSSPTRMSRETVHALLGRVATYCRDEGIREIAFVFHGGEPLLAGKDFFRDFSRQARTILGDDVSPSYSMQTNGTLLTPEWLDLLDELGIGIGISLDGPAATHDANRIYHRGGGSYAAVRRAIRTVLADARFAELFGGVLTVINLEADPISIYDHFRELDVRRCDFLLPDGTYDHPPPAHSISGSETPYAEWLITIFDKWFDSEDTSLSIRLFEDIMRLLFAPGFGFDSIGGGQNGALVIEADGGIEPIDVLKICGPAFTKLGLNVHTNEIRDAYSSELVRLYQSGAAALCETCRACPVMAVCGGGHLAHRYSSRNGFGNPSVYCQDLMKLITHIRNRVLATIPSAVRDRLGMQTLSYEAARALLEADGTRRGQQRGGHCVRDA